MTTTQTHLNKLRRDKFILVLTLPNIMKSIETSQIREDEYVNLDSIQFSVYNFTVPKVSIPEHPLHYSGQNYNVTSYDRPAYAPVTVNFEVDNEFKNYWVLWKWLQLLQDPIDGTYAGKGIFPDGAPNDPPHGAPIINPTDAISAGQRSLPYNYQTEIKAYALDEYNNKTAEFVYKYAFITELGELDYNYRDDTQLQTSFSFVFNQLDVNLL